MWPSLGESALCIGEEVVTYGELLLVGAQTGVLEPARARTRRSLQATAGDDGSVGDDLRTEAVAFRRARRLESGEDLRSWLAARQLTMKDWEGYLRRRLAATAEAVPVEAPVDDGLAHRAVTVDLACDGWWHNVATEVVRYWAAGRLADDNRRLAGEDGSAGPPHRAGDPPTALAAAERLARSLAHFGTLDTQWCADRLRVLSCRQRSLEQARLRLCSAAAVAARVADRAADWTELVFERLHLPTVAAANEALMCSREDRLPPEEIARRSGRELERLRRRHDRLSRPEAALLSGALPGEALGPLASDGGVVVLWLKERCPPSAGDPETSQVAAAELLAEALERVSAGRARVVGPL